MLKTAQLITEAENSGTPLAQIARTLGLGANTLAVAKKNQRLSPGVTAALALWLKKPPQEIAQWTIQAIAESERSAVLRRQLNQISRSMTETKMYPPAP